MKPRDGTNDVQIERNFWLYEFQDPTTRTVIIHPALILACQMIRDEIRQPLYVISGYRTVRYNDTLPDAVNNSAHLYGWAADVRAASLKHDVISEIARKIGVPRIKVYPAIRGKRLGWVHIGFNTLNQIRRFLDHAL